MTDNGVRGSIKILVGGAPLDAAFAKKIGADAYAKDAVSAADAAKKLLDERKAAHTAAGS